ncbi:MAG: DUF2242 domain-containing protein [Burkholderiales bacterium]|nr:DUF2242 domain-containing protein [Burkholderiales bacterium]
MARNRSMKHPTRIRRWPVGTVLSVALLTACSTSNRARIEPEAFGSTTTHARNYASPPARTCEAARRALLSQGFVITAANAAQVDGRKNFQPEHDLHVVLEFHVVCAADGRGGKKSIAFVNALQDRYALKKSNNSASVGVGAIGSLSLPFTSSDDSLVRVASETVTAASFYERYFVLLQRFLAVDYEQDESKAIEPAGLAPQPARPAASAASTP